MKLESDHLKDMPSSPSGRFREEHVRDKFRTSGRLKSTTARLLLLEPHDQFAGRVKEVSNIDFIGMKVDDELKFADTFEKIINYERARLKELEMFMQKVRDSHPQLKRRK